MVGQQQSSKEHIEVAQQFFHLVGSSASECDTIPGRQCMASSFILLKQFEDSLLYLDSIKTYFVQNDSFNFNYGQTKVALGEYAEAEEAFLQVKSEKIKSTYPFISQFCKCCELKFHSILTLKSNSQWQIRYRVGHLLENGKFN